MTDSILIKLAKLADIAEIEFADVVMGWDITEGKLRLYITDKSILDIWFSRQLEGRYAYHWERRHVDNTIYRWDNAKHEIWKNIKTFPHHFHEKTDDHVIESPLPGDQIRAIRFILDFVRNVINKNIINPDDM